MLSQHSAMPSERIPRVSTTATKNSGAVAAGLRKMGGWRLAWVGQKTGISESRLCRYENGDVMLPPAKRAIVERVLIAELRKRAAEIQRVLAG